MGLAACEIRTMKIRLEMVIRSSSYHAQDGPPDTVSRVIEIAPESYDDVTKAVRAICSARGYSVYISEVK